MAAEEKDADQAVQDNPDVQTDDQDVASEETQKLHLDVRIEPRSACQRHITVTIPREDIDRYFDEAFRELMPTANVPGFRPGRAPRALVEQRYRKEVKEQVKGSLLMDALTQVTEQENLAAISEPDIDVMAVELPDEGPMVFEFDLEVRPEFELPEWKGLKIERPVREFTEEDVKRRLERLLAQHGRLVPHDGPAEPGDYITVNITFKDGDRVLSEGKEELIRIRRVLSFRDARIDDFDKKMAGVKAGETREIDVTISDEAPDESLRGKTVKGIFEVLEVKRLELPKLTPELLEQLGGFKSEEELREAVREDLKRRLAFEQQQRARKQVLAALTESADWELPPDLLQRQTKREIERLVMELRSAGFSEEEIQARANVIWQNSQSATEQALKEHFVLERIAEEEGIEASPEDYDEEIYRIALQTRQTPRRIRAQLEKQDLMDSLRNQIIERKTVDRILEHAEFQDVPFEVEESDEFAIEQAAGGTPESEIPEAKYSDEQQRREPEDRS